MLFEVAHRSFKKSTIPKLKKLIKISIDHSENDETLLANQVSIDEEVTDVQADYNLD